MNNVLRSHFKRIKLSRMYTEKKKKVSEGTHTKPLILVFPRRVALEEGWKSHLHRL